MDGECIKQDFYFIPEDFVPDPKKVEVPEFKECCFELKVLASLGADDELKDDRTSELLWVNKDLVSGIVMRLQKEDSEGEFQSVYNLNDNVQGEFFSYRFFENDLGENFIGYQIYWKNVLTNFGIGKYRVKFEITSVFGDNKETYGFEYCLEEYSPITAEGTIRIEFNNSGVFGNIDDKKKNDFGELFWYNSLRLDGYFGFPKSTYELDYVQYNNGQRLYVKDEQEPEYILFLKPLPAFIHNYIRSTALQADQILITDYNSKNPDSYVQKAVILNGEYSPKWNIMKNRKASVEVSFRQEYNNLKKFRQ